MNNSVHGSLKVSPAEEGQAIDTLTGCETYTIVSSKGKNLFARCWKPPAGVPERGIVILSHGFSEHLGYYEALATALSNEGLIAFGHDHVGHGRSEGTRCHISDATEYVEDVVLHIARKRKECPSLPCYIIGHSMGGMISISVALRAEADISGMVLMGPLILPDPREATVTKVTIVRILAWISPYFPVGRLRRELITRDEEVLKRISKDTLWYQGAVRAQWACACLDQLLENRNNFSKFSVPFLIQHGEMDGLCTITGSKLMVTEAPVKDKDLKIFPDARHNLYQEIPDTRKEAVSQTVQWILQRLPSK